MYPNDSKNQSQQSKLIYPPPGPGPRPPFFGPYPPPYNPPFSPFPWGPSRQCPNCRPFNRYRRPYRRPGRGPFIFSDHSDQDFNDKN